MEKRLLVAILIFSLIFIIVGCSSNKNDKKEPSIENNNGETNNSQEDNNSNNNEQNNDNSKEETEIIIKNGTEVAKILLAQERLDENYLITDGNIFTDGKRSLARLVDKTKYYSKRNSGRPNETYTEVEGDTYKWYCDNDYSNNMGFLNSHTSNIIHYSQQGSELIDDAKSYIRVLNSWVKVYNHQYFLIVTKDSETIIRRASDGYVDMCKRYTNENGISVYEILHITGEFNVRMKYIPGLLYEYSQVPTNGNGTSLYLHADNYKGYWQVLHTLGIFHYESQNGNSGYTGTLFYFVMKEDASYILNYIISSNEGGIIDQIKVLSSDRRTDLVSISKNTIDLYNTGVSGLDYIAIDAPSDKVGETKESSAKGLWVHKGTGTKKDGTKYDKYAMSGRQSGYAVCDNGLIINQNDEFVNGKAIVKEVHISSISGFDAYGNISFKTTADTYDEQIEILESLMNETSLTFRRDYDEVILGIKYSINDANNFPLYYKLNGYHINNIEDARKAIEEENNKINELIEVYNQVKDLEVINISDQEKYNSNLQLSDVEIINKPNVTNDGFVITVSDLKLKVLDTILFVDKEKYKINFGLLSDNNNIITFLSEDYTEFEYLKEEEFILEQSLTFEISLLEEGEYKLVAYVALASEGIQITKYVGLEAQVTEYKYTSLGFINKITTNENNHLIIKSEKDLNIYSTINGNYTYEELENYMLQLNYEFGMISDNKIEIFDGENWIVYEQSINNENVNSDSSNTEESPEETPNNNDLTNTGGVSEEIPSENMEVENYMSFGNYRLKYSPYNSNNGDNDYYIYINLE